MTEEKLVFNVAVPEATLTIPLDFLYELKGCTIKNVLVTGFRMIIEDNCNVVPIFEVELLVERTVENAVDIKKLKNSRESRSSTVPTKEVKQ